MAVDQCGYESECEGCDQEAHQAGKTNEQRLSPRLPGVGAAVRLLDEPRLFFSECKIPCEQKHCAGRPEGSIAREGNKNAEKTGAQESETDVKPYLV